MSHTEFVHLLSSINALSPEQMRQLSRTLDAKIAEAEMRSTEHGQGSLGATRDAAEELDEAVEHATKLRQRPWRVPTGELHRRDSAWEKCP
jgi:hypothetical protein